MWSIIIIIFKVLSKDFKTGILATNIWPKSENLGTWFEITFVRFYICNLIWLEIFESKPVTCDRWSLCSNSNPNMDFGIWFWVFLIQQTCEKNVQWSTIWLKNIQPNQIKYVKRAWKAIFETIEISIFKVSLTKIWKFGHLIWNHVWTFIHM